MKKKPVKKIVTTVRLDPKTIKRMKRLTRRMDTCFAQFIRDAVESHLTYFEG